MEAMQLLSFLEFYHQKSLKTMKTSLKIMDYHHLFHSMLKVITYEKLKILLLQHLLRNTLLDQRM